jgi:hypothetical protein
MPAQPTETGTIMEDRKHRQAGNHPPSDAAARNSAPALLTYQDLHLKTGFSLSTLRRRVKEGRIPFFQPGGPRTRVVFPADVVELLLSQSPVSEQPQTPVAAPPSPAAQRGPRPKWLG